MYMLHFTIEVKLTQYHIICIYIQSIPNNAEKCSNRKSLLRLYSWQEISTCLTNFDSKMLGIPA